MQLRLLGNDDRKALRPRAVLETADVTVRIERDVRFAGVTAKSLPWPPGYLACESDGEFTVTVRTDRRYVLDRAGDNRVVIQCGRFCDYWDPDLQEVLGLSKATYRAMNLDQRAAANARVQLAKYAAHDFFNPREWDVVLTRPGLVGRAGAGAEATSGPGADRALDSVLTLTGGDLGR